MTSIEVFINKVQLKAALGEKAGIWCKYLVIIEGSFWLRVLD